MYFFRLFVWENKPKSETWATLTPRPQPYVVQKVDQTSKTPSPWTTKWSKQYLSAVHPVTCSLL